MKNCSNKLIELFIFISFIALYALVYTPVITASSWQKYPGNPLFFDNNQWNNGLVLEPYILKENNLYRMWYVGHNGSGWRIGYAYSLNGIQNWVQNSNPILQYGSNDGWESGNENPNVIYNNQLKKYQMWYTSVNSSHWYVGLDRFRLRYATSTDGINWDKTDGWASTINSNAWASSTSWDSGGIARGISILYKDSYYHLWYSATNSNNLAWSPFWRIGYATSPDGINWTKQNNGNPVITPTKAWELNNVSFPTVIFENGIYKMWYVANYGDAGDQIVYATSQDGINWDKPEDQNPVLTKSNFGFGNININSPFIMRDGNMYKMWYLGNYGSSLRIGYATASAEVNSDLDVPLIKQTKDPWQSETYDTATNWNPSNPTINRWGCALTSATMILNYYGINKIDENTDLDPGTLNDWLNDQEDGYVGTGWINWLAVSRLSSLSTEINNITDFKALEYSRVSGTDSAKLKESLKNDINNSIPGILAEPGHFIVAKGINEDTFNINDPFYDIETLDDHKYSNSFLSYGKYTSSKTDLSYIMLVTDQNIKLSVASSSGKIVGEEFIQQPIIDPVTGTKNGNPIKMFYLPKPETGEYRILISSDNYQTYNLGIYLYDISGNVNKIEQDGITGPNNSEIILINFDKQNSGSSRIKRTVTFQTTLDDIKELYALGLIHPAISGNLNSIIKNSKSFFEKGKKKQSLLLLNAFENLIKATRNKGLDEKAYQILLYDIQYLKTHL
ncbi:MAG: C39 family peptidase [Candidatus Levybacteria bacterium]|nr:C39 family peptidase [Candidatus Levybacteria bacterium]